jgi:flagellar protein FlgJ
MKKIDPQLRILLTVFVLVFVAVIFMNQIFRAMGLSIHNTKPFKYVGKTPKSDWYNWISPIAKIVGAQYGIPWQAMCVQTAVETGWGKSSLFSKYNNFGGVKYAGSGAPSKVNMKTGEVFNGQATTINADFASWPTPYDGMIGYANFFHRNKRYAEALKYPNDPFRFIEEIKKAGYATAPNYVATLQGMLVNDLKISKA